MQIDVILLTKNSQHLLAKCLTSIYSNIPVNKLIVVDGYSKDHTVQILEEFQKKHGNLKIIQIGGTRARAREIGISQVSTEYFVFVDSDVVLCKDWFKKAQMDMTEGVGAVWGLNIDVIPNVKQKWFLLLEGMIARQGFSLRGGTHDTLIRRSKRTLLFIESTPLLLTAFLMALTRMTIMKLQHYLKRQLNKTLPR